MAATAPLDSAVLPSLIRDGGVLDAELLFGRALEEMGLAQLRFGPSPDAPDLALVVGEGAREGFADNGVLAEWMMASDELAKILFNRRLWRVVYRKAGDGFSADEQWRPEEAGAASYGEVPLADEAMPNSLRYLVIKQALAECLQVEGDYVIDRERSGFYGDLDALAEGDIIEFPSMTALMAGRLFNLTSTLSENALRNRARRELDEEAARARDGLESGI